MARLGILDWGIGGVSIYRIIKERAAKAPVTYLSDTGATPYGKMSRDELVSRLNAVIMFLKTRGVTHLAIGCNAASTSWQNGWIVFSDVKNDQTVDTGDTILRVQNAFASQDTFTSGTTTAYAVTFNREGFASLGGASLTITLHDSSASQNYSRCLDISQAGMMAVQTHSSDTSCQ